MPFRSSIKHLKKFVVHNILHIDDTPHRLALGVAIGIFVGWTPTIGLQSAITILLALMLKANKVVGLPLVWISNPFTLVPIYWPNYLIGNAVMTIFVGDRPRMTFKMFEQAVMELLKNTFNILSRDSWAQLHQILIKFLDFTVDLWVGSALVGLILAIISYFVSYKAIDWYRHHTPKGRAFMKKLLLKKNRQKGLINNASNELDQ